MVAGVPVAGVAVAGVVVAGVPVAGVAVAGVTLSRVHNFKHFSPRDFTHDFQLVRCTLILALCNCAVSDYFSNMIVGVKSVVVEAISGVLAKVHTHIADGWVYIFFKCAWAGILFAFARPIRIKNFIPFYAHLFILLSLQIKISYQAFYCITVIFPAGGEKIA